MKQPRKRIAIIGAGLRGLASGAYLKRKGYEVVIYEKSHALGGIWNRVFSGSSVNSRSYTYTFHTSNVWPQEYPDKQQIIDNLSKLAQQEELTDSIRFNTEVLGLQKAELNSWNVLTECGKQGPFHGVLACAGHLGEQKLPPSDVSENYRGEILLPYAFDSSRLKGKRVAVVGSGSTALEMTILADKEGSQSVQLVMKPQIQIREAHSESFMAPLKNTLSHHPLLFYAPNKIAHPAYCVGIEACLEKEHVAVLRSESVSCASGDLELTDGSLLVPDLVIWCSGWIPGMPDWMHQFRTEPTVIAAACARCRDTRSMGFGAATIYAKALHIILKHNLQESFSSSLSGCDCEQEHEQHAPHILKTAWTYFMRQPGRQRILMELLCDGVCSNTRRLLYNRDPLWVRGMSFLVAPYGL